MNTIQTKVTCARTHIYYQHQVVKVSFAARYRSRNAHWFCNVLVYEHVVTVLLA